MGREDPIEFYMMYFFFSLFKLCGDIIIFCWGDGKISITLPPMLSLICVLVILYY